MWFTINYSIPGSFSFAPEFEEVYASSKQDAERNILLRHPNYQIHYTTTTYAFYYGERKEPFVNIFG